MKRYQYFTSESVTEGHPDKVADLIADNILDEYLKQDPYSRVACEVTVIKNRVHVFGEVTTKAKLKIKPIVKRVIKEIGYTKKEYGFCYKNVKIDVNLNKQSGDIALGVDIGGAGDQGIMFGYADTEAPEYTPAALYYAHTLAKRLTIVRKEGIIPYLRPDGKTQVTIKYDENRNLIGISHIVVSASHDDNITLEQIKADIKKHVINAVIPENLLLPETQYFINQTGKFVTCGPASDSGLTGRKIIVDTYGGYCPHGGGSFSGKDSTKVDRSAAYMARYLAKNIIASGICKKISIQLSYVIGKSQPLSLNINTFGSSLVNKDIIIKAIYDNFDLSPAGIIKKLRLREPNFSKTTNYGHFGKDDKELVYEQLDSVDIFSNLIKE